MTVEFKFRTRSTVPHPSPSPSPSPISLPSILSNTQKNANDEQPRPRQWEPCAACPTVSSCVAFPTGKFFFSFFFPVHISFQTVQHVPATLAPTTSHCRPQHVHSQGPPPQPLCLDPVGLCPVPSPGAQYPTMSSEQVSSITHCAYLAVHSPNRTSLHITSLCGGHRCVVRPRDGHHFTLSLDDAVATTSPVLKRSVSPTSLHHLAPPRCPTTLWPLQHWIVQWPHFAASLIAPPPPPTSPDCVVVAASLLNDLVATAWWPTSPDLTVPRHLTVGWPTRRPIM